MDCVAITGPDTEVEDLFADNMASAEAIKSDALACRTPTALNQICKANARKVRESRLTRSV
jgi:hypothetical protein